MDGYTVPLELVDYIVQLHIGNVSGECLRISDYHQFKALVLVSTAVRFLAIRRFLERVYLDIKDRAQWDCAAAWMLGPDSVRSKEIASPLRWIRKLSTSTDVVLSNADMLATLPQLTELSLSFEHQGLVTQKPALIALTSLLPRQKSAVSSKLTFLSLTSLSFIDVPLLRLISDAFPSLLRLHLSCTERISDNHCWGCYEESLQCVMHSPIPDVYPTQLDLTAAFAEALAPLKNLQDLHLGIFLSPEYVVNSHVAHANPIDEEGKPYTDVYGPDECTLCEVHSLNVRYQELVASLYFARSFKSLRTVGWSSFFADSRYAESQKVRQKPIGRRFDGSQDERETEEGTTKVWILRADGKVRVRRKPWCSEGEASTRVEDESRVRCISL